MRREYVCSVPGFWSTQVDFQIIVQLILVNVCLQISCTTTKKSTSVLQNPGSDDVVIPHLIHDEFWRLHVGRVDVEVGGQLVRLRAAEAEQARGRAHRGRGRAPRVFLGGHHRKRLENILRILQQFYIIT